MPCQHGRMPLDAITSVPPPANEPVRSYGPGTRERSSLEERIKELAAEPVELTVTIAGEQRPGGGMPIDVVQPHRRHSLLGTMQQATNEDYRAAVDASLAAAHEWREMAYAGRVAS